MAVQSDKQATAAPGRANNDHTALDAVCKLQNMSRDIATGKLNRCKEKGKKSKSITFTLTGHVCSTLSALISLCNASINM